MGEPQRHAEAYEVNRVLGRLRGICIGEEPDREGQYFHYLAMRLYALALLGRHRPAYREAVAAAAAWGSHLPHSSPLRPNIPYKAVGAGDSARLPPAVATPVYRRACPSSSAEVLCTSCRTVVRNIVAI